MNDELRELTLRRASVSELRQAAIKNGMKLMFDDGIRKVRLGITTMDEVLTVTGE
jgi:type II secretory ATPase GspE/PulE/Tfp pilus assembly ATPase PilB-like protein